jgi:hypothetical protein
LTTSEKENKYSKQSSIFLATYGKCRYKKSRDFYEKKFELEWLLKISKIHLILALFDFLKLAFLAI